MIHIISCEGTESASAGRGIPLFMLVFDLCLIDTHGQARGTLRRKRAALDRTSSGNPPLPPAIADMRSGHHSPTGMPVEL